MDIGRYNASTMKILTIDEGQEGTICRILLVDTVENLDFLTEYCDDFIKNSQQLLCKNIG